MYDEITPIGDNFSLIMVFIVLIGYFYSLFLLFRFKKLGRQIYTIVVALSLLLVFSLGYVVYDPLESFIDSSSLILTPLFVEIIISSPSLTGNDEVIFPFLGEFTIPIIPFPG